MAQVKLTRIERIRRLRDVAWLRFIEASRDYEQSKKRLDQHRHVWYVLDCEVRREQGFDPIKLGC